MGPFLVLLLLGLFVVVLYKLICNNKAIARLIKKIKREELKSSDDRESQFVDYLKQMTLTKEEVVNRELEEQRKVESEIIEYENKRFDNVVEKIKQRTVAKAQLGIRRLDAVITDNGFSEFESDDTLQTIKANYDNDFGTKFYSITVANQLKNVLSSKLDELGVKNDVYIESSSHYSYVPKISRTGRNYKVKEYTDFRSNSFIIRFSLKW